jgi:dTDP-4-amino-4,6-dideoxygalactose transaminase
MNDHRRALAARYDAALAGLPLLLPAVRPGVHDPVPTHLQPAVAQYGSSRLPETERLVDEILSLPISAGHTMAEIDVVAAAVREFFGL